MGCRSQKSFREITLVRTKLALSKTGCFLQRLKSWGWGSFPLFQFLEVWEELFHSHPGSSWKLSARVATWLACYRMGTVPEPKMAEKWLAKWPAANFGGGGPKMAEKWPGKRPFWTPPQKMAADFPAIFGSDPASHSVAGQPSRNARVGIPIVWCKA